jgi:hypothetical protein
MRYEVLSAATTNITVFWDMPSLEETVEREREKNEI